MGDVNTQQNVEQQGSQQQNTQVAQPAKQVEQPIFTQEQVNSIVAGRVTQLNNKITGLENDVNTYKTQAEDYKAKYEALEQQSLMTEAGIPNSIKDYVKFEVSKLSSNGKSFSDNFAEYVKANQSFIDTIKQNEGSAGGSKNGSDNQNNTGTQSTLLQQLASGSKNTNGSGNQSMNTGDMSGIDVEKILASRGIKRRIVK